MAIPLLRVILLSGCLSLLTAPIQEARFESEIKAYEEADRRSPPAKGGIVFVGSSSIRMWSTLAQDFPEFPVLNRGFGGSVIRESTEFAPRLIFPHKPRMVVFFAGSNDLAEGDTSSQVLANFKDFVGVVRKELADCRIAFIAITPAPSRWNNLAAMQEANRLVQNWIYTEDNLAFINTYPLFVTKEGGPRPELFLHDQLHLNSEGYGLWRRAVRPYLSWGLEDRGREAW